MANVGIIGQGFVGGAIREGFKNTHTLHIYDKFNLEHNTTDLAGVVANAPVIFVCVPTPMDAETGQASVAIVEEVIAEIDDLAADVGTNPTVVIKSTVPPGTTERINATTSYTEVTFNPEFLTEANAVEDFKNQNRIIIGVCEDYSGSDVISVFREVFPNIEMPVVDSKSAEMCKYTINNYLSVKVSFANEIYDICEANDIEYNEVKDLVMLDNRLGTSHWMVPGPDGDRGFGGHCFPKDLNAMIYIAEKSGVDASVIKSAWETNERVRSDRDWEAQEGRAIIHSKKEGLISKLFKTIA